MAKKVWAGWFNGTLPDETLWERFGHTTGQTGDRLRARHNVTQYTVCARMQHKTKRWGLLLVNCNGLFARFRVLVTIRFWTFASQSCPHDSKQGPGKLQVYIYKWAARHGHFVSWYRDCGRLGFNSLMTCEQLFLSKNRIIRLYQNKEMWKGVLSGPLCDKILWKGLKCWLQKGSQRWGGVVCVWLCAETGQDVILAEVGMTCPAELKKRKTAFF